MRWRGSGATTEGRPERTRARETEPRARPTRRTAARSDALAARRGAEERGARWTGFGYVFTHGDETPNGELDAFPLARGFSDGGTP